MCVVKAALATSATGAAATATAEVAAAAGCIAAGGAAAGAGILAVPLGCREREDSVVTPCIQDDEHTTGPNHPSLHTQKSGLFMKNPDSAHSALCMLE